MSSGPLQPFAGQGDDASLTIIEHQGTSRIALFGGLGLGVLVFAAVVAFATSATAFALILAVGAAGAALFVVPRVIATSRWEAAQITIERYPFQLGDEVNVRFQQRAQGAKVPAEDDGPATFTLVCTERATYTVGADRYAGHVEPIDPIAGHTRTETHTVAEYSWEAPGQRVSGTYIANTNTRTETHTVAEYSWEAPGQRVSGTYIADTILRVPLERGAPTFECDHNEVAWELKVHTPDPLPSFERAFKVVVLPVIASGRSLPPSQLVQDT